MKFTEEELEKLKKEKMEEIDRWLDNEFGISYTGYKNIIDELEKAYYKMEEKQVEIDGRGYYYTDLIPIEEILNKLKELKGE